MPLNLKVKVLIVEDNETTAKALAEDLNPTDASFIEVVVAHSAATAVELAKSGDVNFCIADLELPETDEQDIKDQKGNTRGFDVILKVAELNREARIYILSNYTDKQIAKGLARLTSGGVNFINPFDKNNDWAGAIKHLVSEISCPVGFQDAIEATKTRIVHIKEYLLARQLWHKAGKAVTCWADVPIITILGDSQMGKDHWARAFAIFRWLQLKNPSMEAPYVERDLGTISGGSQPQIALFGARSFNGRGIDSPGVLESATAYRGENGEIISPLNAPRVAVATDEPIFEESVTAILSELGNLLPELQQLLLQVTQKNGGFVVPAGVTAAAIRIGCPIVFTTNAPLSKMVVESTEARDGKFREDLFRRLTTQETGWLRVPSFTEMGFEAFWSHLILALTKRAGRHVPWAPIVRQEMAQVFEDQPSDFRMNTIDAIVDAFAADPEMERLQYMHFQAAIKTFGERAIVKRRSPIPMEGTLPDISYFLDEGILRPETKQRSILDQLLNAAPQRLSEDDLLSNMKEKYPEMTLGSLKSAITGLKKNLQKKKQLVGVELEWKQRRVRVIKINSGT